jgi:hypothetical protein
VSLPDPTNRRIARHLADGLELVGQQQSLCAKARRCSCGLAAGVPTANDNDVEPIHGGSIGEGRITHKRAGMFHVKQSLLADTEIAEDGIQHLLNVHPTGNPSDRPGGQA